jgi:prephenate dehydrogenase
MHITLAIIGLDRLGTSFGLALKRYQAQPKAEHRFTIIGSDPRSEPMKIAQKRGAIDDSDRSPDKAVANADLVIVSTPYGKLEELYTRLGPKLKPGAVVFDTSPLKQPVIEWAKRSFPSDQQGIPLAYLVGITPVVSADGLYSGDQTAEAARADLFDRAEILITPDARCPGDAITLAENVIHLMGGKTRFMDPAEHDSLVAATEGLPALLGSALFYTLLQSEGWPELRRMVNPNLALVMQGLRYQSQSDLLAFFTQSRDDLARHLGMFVNVLKQIYELLAAGDEKADELEAFLAIVEKAWQKWDFKRYSGEWEERPDLDIPRPGILGSMGIFTLNRRKRDTEGDEG